MYCFFGAYDVRTSVAFKNPVVDQEQHGYRWRHLEDNFPCIEHLEHENTALSLLLCCFQLQVKVRIRL